MALLFTEGFDWTTTPGDLVTYLKWFDRSGTTIGNTSGTLRFGSSSGNYLAFGTNRNDYVRRAIGSNLASGLIGVAVRFAGSGSNLYRTNIITLFDTTANVQCGLILNNDLTCSVIRTSWSNVIATSTFTFAIDTWYYLEMKWKISDSLTSGDFVVYVDGTPIITLSTSSDTKNTSNAYATHYAFGGNSPTVTATSGNSLWFIDDHYLCDLTGSVNNAFKSNVRIQTLYPNANGNSSQWTGSDGNSTNNYQLVDETSIATSDYVDGTTVGNKDTYGFTDTVSTTTVVHGLTVNQVALRTDATARSMAPVIRTNSTDYTGSNISLNATATAHQTVYEQNPDTSSGWTKSEVDGAEFGAEVTV